ncbi:hypothetical protein MCELHM10_03560 [Paracoccaceae bacterium]|jgi:hypothetical protein
MLSDPVPEIADRSLTYRSLTSGRFGFWICTLVAVQTIAMGITVVIHNVNWDEFNFLQLVHEFLRGDPVRALQTFHVRLFGWLTWFPDAGLTQIIVGRGVMLTLVIGTAVLTGFLTRHLVLVGIAGDRHISDAGIAGLLAAAAFLTSGYVTIHAASFRADPLLAFLLMVAITILFTRSGLVWFGLAAFATALALVISVKSALWLPVFLAALIWRTPEKGVPLRMVIAGLATLPMVAILLFWHAQGLNAAQTEGSAATLSDALFTGVLNGGFLPRQLTVVVWAVVSIPAIGAVLTVLASRRGSPGGTATGRARLALFLLMAPIFSVLVYRNAFPYFFPFITPPLMVVAGVGLSGLLAHKRVSTVVMLWMSMAVGAQFLRATGEGNSDQRMTTDALRRIFPTPVAYIDRSAALPEFSKAGPFLSGWGLQKYRDAGIPVFANLIRERQPPFVLATSAALLAALEGRHSANAGLLPADQKALFQNYVHFSGPVWLAGKNLVVGPGPQETAILIAGRYQVLTEGPVILNGQTVGPGGIVDLRTGPLVFTTGGNGETAVTLILAVREEERANIPDGGFYADF